jgi:YesN/AraC family two-component response regulator
MRGKAKRYIKKPTKKKKIEEKLIKIQAIYSKKRKCKTPIN